MEETFVEVPALRMDEGTAEVPAPWSDVEKRSAGKEEDDANYVSGSSDEKSAGSERAFGTIYSQNLPRERKTLQFDMLKFWQEHQKDKRGLQERKYMVTLLSDLGTSNASSVSLPVSDAGDAGSSSGEGEAISQLHP